MAKAPRTDDANLFKLLLTAFVIFLLLYGARGLGLITFMPGGIVLVLGVMTIAIFILWAIEWTKGW